MDIKDPQLAEAYALLYRIDHGLMPITVERLFCDYFRITPNRAEQIVERLHDMCKIKWEPGWLQVIK